MPLITRFTARLSTPDNKIKVYEATTTKRIKFFEAYDERYEHETLRSIAADKSVTSPTTRRWLRQRQNLGSIIYRRTRKLSKRLGHQSQITREQCQMLVDPARNQVRNQLYDAQIEYHYIPGLVR
jgi:hypothetical protein